MEQLQLRVIARRPLAITIVCLICFISAPIAALISLSPEMQSVGSWYPLFMWISGVGSIICLVGLWRMKKWGLIAYVLWTAIAWVVLAAASSLGWSDWPSLLGPSMVAAVGAKYYKKMA